MSVQLCALHICQSFIEDWEKERKERERRKRRQDKLINYFGQISSAQ
jgi:hypothetical protein